MCVWNFVSKHIHVVWQWCGKNWCTAANTALSECSLTMFPLHSLDRDCSTVLKSFSLHMKCSFFVLVCFVFFISCVKKWLGFQFSNHQVCRKQNVKYRKVQFLKDDVYRVFITYQKIIQSTQMIVIETISVFTVCNIFKPDFITRQTII